MKYLAVIDYEHLDDGVFLSSLARSLTQIDYSRMVIVHGESAYTERIIQTGVMREEATLRSLRDLNNRLVALLADEGVSAVGLNSYRRPLVRRENDRLELDREFLRKLPHGPLLLISALAMDMAENRPMPISLPRMTRFLGDKLDPEEVLLFCRSDESEVFTESFTDEAAGWDETDAGLREKLLPEEFRDFGEPVRLTTARDLQNLPNLEQTKPIL